MRSRAPADRGLACLGLLAQLAGNVFAAYGVLAALAALFSRRGEDDSLWIFLVLASGAARALVHRAAGVQLVYGDRAIGVPGPVEPSPTDERRLAGVHRYLAAAVAHTAFVAVIAHCALDASAGATVALAAALLVWPAVLAVAITRPGLRALGRHLPAAEDRGFEAMAIVMTILACGGLALGLALLGLLLDQPGEALQQGPTLAAILLMCTLVVRSGLHLRAGIAGLRETSMELAVARATSYADFGVISTFCAGAALVLAVTLARFDLVGLSIVAGLVWMLLAWPLIVRRFVRDRQFDDLLAGDASVHHRAPDAGLSGLGWLLAGHAAIALTWLLLRVATADHRVLREAVGLFEAPHALVAAQLAVISLAGWAAVELVGMTARATAAAVVWAVAAAALAGILVAPMLSDGFPSFDELPAVAWLAGQIVLAAATLLLVTRRIAPAARARYRPARSTIST